MLDEYASTGTLIWRQLPPLSSIITLNPYFSDAINEYSDYIQEGISKRTAHDRIAMAKQLLVFFEQQGYMDFSRVTPKDLSRFLLSISEKHKASMKNVIAMLRFFIRFLNERSLLKVDLLPLLQIRVANRRKLQPSFTTQEADKLLSAADRTTKNGKRDYAIMLLASQTGLRGIDVVNLRFDSIDWHNDEIKITQRKTGAPLTLPLEPDVADAISEYILTARPESASQNIFLRHNAPYNAFSDKGACKNIASKYMLKAEVQSSPEHKKGFHCFRRLLGTRLLKANIDLKLINQILGHVDEDTAKSYLLTDTESLRLCALDLSGIEPSGSLTI